MTTCRICRWYIDPPALADIGTKGACAFNPPTVITVPGTMKDHGQLIPVMRVEAVRVPVAAGEYCSHHSPRPPSIIT